MSMPDMKRRWRRVAFAAAALLGAATSGAQAKDAFVFAWPSAVNSGVAPLTFARQLGYFDAENLDVQIQVLTGSGVIIPQLMAGKINAAYASLEPLVIARQPGKPNFPLRFVYNLFPRTIWEFAVLEGSPIRSLADLRGRTIGVLALSSGNIYMTRAMLQAAGVPWNEVKLQAVGTGVSAFEALRNGQIDVLNLFDTAHVRLEQAGTPIRRLEIPSALLNSSSHGIEVTDAALRSNPDLFERFGRALTKGSVACRANLPACVRSYWAAYPALRPTTGTEEENLRREVQVLELRMRNLMPPGSGTERPHGAFSDADWTILIDALRVGGEVSNTNVPLATLYTNALVPGYNRFDPASVEAEARAAQ
ncbi:ABC transporter substrate-binding protein [Pararoseomonas sp. SCSIO 73927]|uniref:ABC transporter substrate-binding protein n=1 Tax=Pararoseomonas sp. SCSIO 73927 TaxID=3114537 RepID=UPI0030D33C27